MLAFSQQPTKAGFSTHPRLLLKVPHMPDRMKEHYLLSRTIQGVRKQSPQLPLFLTLHS